MSYSQSVSAAGSCSNEGGGGGSGHQVLKAAVAAGEVLTAASAAVAPEKWGEILRSSALDPASGATRRDSIVPEEENSAV